MKKLLIVVLASISLSGCLTVPSKRAPISSVGNQQEPVQAPIQTRPQAPVIQQPGPVPTQPVIIAAPTQPLEQPPVVMAPPPAPKVPTINWNNSVAPLVSKMLAASGVQPGSVLLLDNVKNSTNGTLPMGQATEALHNALSNSNKFSIVSNDQLAAAKQSLGLSADDSLGSRSKALGLARVVKAQYVLYSDVRGEVRAPKMDMQLMTVPGGEIVWSGSGVVQR